MNDLVYQYYKGYKQLIKAASECKNPHGEKEMQQLEEWENLMEVLEQADPDYKVRFEREARIIASFTQEQIDHICYQIGDWYLAMKPLLEGQHNLGFMKEKLKAMICGGDEHVSS
jgi:hypothetical protein